MASHPCAQIAEAAARLTCFDRSFPAVARPAASGVSAAGATTPMATTLAAPYATADAIEKAARFGLPPDPRATARDLDTISALVREVSALRHGERVFVLDNDQRWAERSAESRGPVQPGDRVSITRAAFGSFVLVTSAGVGLPVRRLP
jgi:hypothetical protein